MEKRSMPGYALRERVSGIYGRYGGAVLAALALAVTLLTLFAGGEIGLSDNRDFGRVMYAASLDYDAYTPYVYMPELRIVLTEDSAVGNVAKIIFGLQGVERYPSLQLVPVRVSVVLNLVLNKLAGTEISTYRVGVLGVLYCLLYALAMWELFRAFKLRCALADAVVKLAMIFVLCDVGYISYFNSLYGEPLQVIGFVWLAARCVSCFTSGNATISVLVKLCTAAVVFGWAKFANIPAALLVALGTLLPLWISSRRRAPLFAAVGVTAALALIYITVPGWMHIETTYNSVFFGVTRGAGETVAREYLRDLGLPEEMSAYADTNYYVEGVSDSLRGNGYLQELEGVSKLDLALFYIRHPSLMAKGIRLSIQNSALLRPFYLSNHDTSHPRLSFTERFSLWSEARKLLGFDKIAGNLAVLLGYCLVLFLALRGRGRFFFFAALTVSIGVWGYNLIVPYISNGGGDLAKHMLGYAQIVDFMLMFMLSSAASLWRSAYFRPVAACAACVAVTLAAYPVGSTASELTRRGMSHEALDEPGAYISLGMMDGKPLLWRVTEVHGGVAELILEEPLGDMRYSGRLDNQWGTSSLRAWLNGEFLSCFTDAERALLLETEHSVLLSASSKSLATAGDRDFYCTHISENADAGIERAYSFSMADTVRLPDISIAAQMAREGYGLATGASYWLETPYYNNGEMCRYVGRDGYIYFRDVTEPLGVRPVICVEASLIVTGEGSCASPLVPAV